jgi:beta-lactamase class A
MVLGLGVCRMRERETGRMIKKERTIAIAIVLSLLLYLAYANQRTILRAFIKPDLVDNEALKSEIAWTLKSRPGTYGVYVKVLETGEEFSINDGEYTAASCYKLPLALLCYEMAASDKLDLDSKLTYIQADYESGTGVLQGYRFGTQFTIRYLAEVAVTESDNVAGNMLLRKLGRQAFVNFHKSLGAQVIPATKNISSPRDLGVFAEEVLRFTRKEPSLGGELLSYLLASRFKDRLPAKLPEDVAVANKIGTWPGTVNDVGIVISDKVSYVVAIMSKDVNNSNAGADAVADLSLAVYRHIISRLDPRLFGESVGKQVLDQAGL